MQQAFFTLIQVSLMDFNVAVLNAKFERNDLVIQKDLIKPNKKQTE